MSIQTGRGGMGMRKHRTMGTPGPNRRYLRIMPIELRRLAGIIIKSPARMYSTVRDLFANEGHRR